jgi:hypothetical protein
MIRKSNRNLMWNSGGLLVAVLAMAASGDEAGPPPVQGNLYAQWARGLSSDPGFFPLAVWLQEPRNAPKYQEAGINLYVGLWQGPTQEQVDELKKHNMPVICDQNAFAIQHLDEKIIVGWMHGDEPDNAQDIRAGWPDLQQADVKITIDGSSFGPYGPPVPPSRIVADYEQIRVIDPTRPVLLNLGQGVVWNYHGRGVRSQHPEDYPEYVKGSDIVSFDIYPARHNKPEIQGQLWYVPKGVANLREWTQDQKIVWNCIECNRAGFMDEKPTPEEVRTEVWMSLIHGSRGIIYFVHHFGPFVEAGLFRDAELLAAVTALNRQITRLAPVLNSPTVEVAKVSSENADVPVALLSKQHGGATYLFAVAMRSGETNATFTVDGLAGERPVEVLDENRTLTLANGQFRDHFSPYEVHLYRIGER